jgi:hypothetical protein
MDCEAGVDQEAGIDVESWSRREGLRKLGCWSSLAEFRMIFLSLSLGNVLTNRGLSTASIVAFSSVVGILRGTRYISSPRDYVIYTLQYIEY